MTRILGIIIILFLSLFCFFLGVKYSKNVRDHASWLFEGKGDEIELPDLSDTENPEMDNPVDQNGKAIDQATPPAEDQNIVPSIDDNDAAEQVPANDNNKPALQNPPAPAAAMKSGLKK